MRVDGGRTGVGDCNGRRRCATGARGRWGRRRSGGLQVAQQRCHAIVVAAGGLGHCGKVGNNSRNAVWSASLKKSYQVGHQVVAAISRGWPSWIGWSGRGCHCRRRCCGGRSRRGRRRWACRRIRRHGGGLRRRHHTRIAPAIRHQVVACHVRRICGELLHRCVDFAGIVGLQAVDQRVRRGARRAIGPKFVPEARRPQAALRLIEGVRIGLEGLYLLDQSGNVALNPLFSIVVAICPRWLLSWIHCVTKVVCAALSWNGAAGVLRAGSGVGLNSACTPVSP